MRTVLCLIAVALSTGAGGSPSAADGPERLAYGDDPSQIAELWLPADADRSGAPVPVVVLIHGGFWRLSYGLDLMDDLAADLVGRGVAVWNVEYRRVGQPGGGWPGTLTDVGDAIDHLAELDTARPLDLDDVSLVGHSAGGHLALWAAGRPGLADDAPGASPVVVPRLVVGLGPVSDLAAAARDGVGAGAVIDLLGGSPDEVPERYEHATPVIADPTVAVVIRGGRDVIVPAAYTKPPGGGVAVVEIADDDHFDLIDPSSASWAAVLQTLGLPD